MSFYEIKQRKKVNREIGVDMYTLMCIKLMTSKNQLYKKKEKKPIY